MRGRQTFDLHLRQDWHGNNSMITTEKKAASPQALVKEIVTELAPATFMIHFGACRPWPGTSQPVNSFSQTLCTMSTDDAATIASFKTDLAEARRQLVELEDSTTRAEQAKTSCSTKLEPFAAPTPEPRLAARTLWRPYQGAHRREGDTPTEGQ
jgi:hypothetical protein